MPRPPNHEHRAPHESEGCNRRQDEEDDDKRHPRPALRRGSVSVADLGLAPVRREQAASGTLQQPSRSLRPWWPSLRVRAARAAAAIAAFLLAGFALGLAFYRGTDYPCFLWIVDDATRCGGKA